MKFTLLPVLLAASALAELSPLKDEKRSWTDPETGLKVDNVGYQGDGIYVAIFDENDAATVQFTPASDVNLTVTDIAVQRRAAPLRRALSKRDWSCSNSQGYYRDMDQANVMAANNARDRGRHDSNHWAWAVVGNEVSYYCVYKGIQYFTYNQIMDRHISVSDKCGGSHKYGYERCSGGCGFLDTAVGRTHKGGNFCTKDFRPV